MTRPGRALLVLLVALLASSCAVNATIEVRVRDNGSGTVRVLIDADAEAVHAAESGGVPLEQAVRLEDLTAAGWDAGAWARPEDGSASIVLSKPFESTEQVAGILREASGDAGPLRLRAARARGFLATKYSVHGRVDLESVGTGVPTDPELLANLSAQSVDPAVIDQHLLAQLKSSFGLKVVARLPGADAKTFRAEPGAVTPIEASSSVRDTSRLLFLLGALGFVVLAAVMWRRGGRPRQRRPQPRPAPKPRSGPNARRGQGSGRGGEPARGPHLPHVPRPHVPQVPLPNVPRPHVPHPHVPHPHLPGRSRPDAPPPPKRKPRPPA